MSLQLVCKNKSNSRQNPSQEKLIKWWWFSKINNTNWLNLKKRGRDFKNSFYNLKYFEKWKKITSFFMHSFFSDHLRPSNNLQNYVPAILSFTEYYLQKSDTFDDIFLTWSLSKIWFFLKKELVSLQ